MVLLLWWGVVPRPVASLILLPQAGDVSATLKELQSVFDGGLYRLVDIKRGTRRPRLPSFQSVVPTLTTGATCIPLCLTSRIGRLSRGG